MSRKTELVLVTALLLLAALLRLWDLSHLPPGFNRDELAHIRITEAMKAGEVSVYYQIGDRLTRAALFGALNTAASDLVGSGLLGYRMLPLWGGLVTLALLYALGRRLFGAPVALIALAAMSVNLRAVLLARTVTAESLVPLFTLLMLLCLAVAFNLRREVTFRVPYTLPFALLAALAGLSGYLHYSTLFLGPLGLLFFLHLWRTGQPLARRAWSMWIFVAVLATIVALPYLVSTLRDPELSEAYILWRERPTTIGQAAEGLLNAAGGLVWQGDERVTVNAGRHALLGPILALLFIVGVLEAIRRWRDPRHTLLLLSLAAGLLTDAWVKPGVTFTAQLVALPAVFLLVGTGGQVAWRELHGRGVARAWRPLTALLLFVLAVNSWGMRDRLYQDWKNSPAVRAAYHSDLAALAAYLDHTPDNLPVSLCITGLNAPGDAGLSPRQILGLMRHRTSEPVRHSDCRAGLVLINAGAPMRFVFADPADRKTMPPELADWLVGAEPIAAPGLPAGSVLRLDVEQRLRDAGGRWGLFAPAYFMPEADSQPVQARLPVPLEEGLTFAGYDPSALDGERRPGGDPIVLVTYWRVDEPLPDDLGIYAHLLGYTQTEPPVLQIEPWAEANSIDVKPGELKPRDFFIQVSYIWLRENLRPDRYALTVGAYRDEVAVLENHLDVLDAAQNYAPHGDRLLLGHITVVES
ncbi:MAG: glycosyltransferase family 39 protein [Anaerolineae bacterium]|nr:glycosyltransferase family 39 protein [Anaerolineae bacterium]